MLTHQDLADAFRVLFDGQAEEAGAFHAVRSGQQRPSSVYCNVITIGVPIGTRAPAIGDWSVTTIGPLPVSSLLTRAVSPASLKLLEA